MRHILIIDDERGSREAIRLVFTKLYRITLAENAIEAFGLISKEHFDLVLLDVAMPGMDGIAFLREIREVFPGIPVIMVSASYTDHIIQEAKHLKAVGFICKPFDVHELRNLVAQTLDASEATRQQQVLKRELARNYTTQVIGNSSAMHRALEQAQDASQTDAPVLIVGEVGTGRELFARQIHSWSNRHKSSFIKLECARFESAQIQEELLGSAHTHNDGRIKSGLIDEVNNGAIYLDEIHYLANEDQQLIHDVIEKKGFVRPGGANKWIPQVARFYASCSHPSQSSQANPSILDDWSKNLAAKTVNVPALRERTEDIPILIAHYMSQLRISLNAALCTVEPEALQKLLSYSWPGNVRELRNVIERMIVLHPSETTLKPEYLPPEINGEAFIQTDPNVISFNDATDALHRQLIISALKRANGVVKNAAIILGVTPRILQLRMDKLQIEAESAIPTTPSQRIPIQPAPITK